MLISFLWGLVQRHPHRNSQVATSEEIQIVPHQQARRDLLAEKIKDLHLAGVPVDEVAAVDLEVQEEEKLKKNQE